MIKISFWLKKSDKEQGSLEYVTIGIPKKAKVENDTWKSRYACEVYFSDMKYNHPPIYGINPIDPLCLASELVKIYFQGLVSRGYIISELESKEPWKLEALSDNFLQEKLKSIPPADRDKVLGIMKETFGKLPHMKEKLDNL